MHNPFEGVEWGNPWDWPYVVAVCLTPLVAIVCIATFFGPGWFLGAAWIGVLSIVEPERVEVARAEYRAKKSYRHSDLA